MSAAACVRSYKVVGVVQPTYRTESVPAENSLPARSRSESVYSCGPLPMLTTCKTAHAICWSSNGSTTLSPSSPGMLVTCAEERVCRSTARDGTGDQTGDDDRFHYWEVSQMRSANRSGALMQIEKSAVGTALFCFVQLGGAFGYSSSGTRYTGGGGVPTMRSWSSRQRRSNSAVDSHSSTSGSPSTGGTS